MTGERRDVRMEERLPAGKERHRTAESGEVVEHPQYLGGGELVAGRMAVRSGVAVHARQVAALRDIEDHHRPLVLGELEKVRGQPG